MNAIEGINLLLDKYAEKHKKKLSPGEKIIGIFNNCTIIFCLNEDGEIKNNAELKWFAYVNSDFAKKCLIKYFEGKLG